MKDEAITYRYWGVACLGCKKLIPLYREHVQFKNQDEPAAAAVAPISVLAVFLAWCGHCIREYPYLTSDIVSYEGPASEMQFHPVFERYRGRRSLSHSAHG